MGARLKTNCLLVGFCVGSRVLGTAVGETVGTGNVGDDVGRGDTVGGSCFLGLYSRLGSPRRSPARVGAVVEATTEAAREIVGVWVGDSVGSGVPKRLSRLASWFPSGSTEVFCAVDTVATVAQIRIQKTTRPLIRSLLFRKRVMAV